MPDHFMYKHTSLVHPVCRLGYEQGSSSHGRQAFLICINEHVSIHTFASIPMHSRILDGK
jgi:hypothetical protein